MPEELKALENANNLMSYVTQGTVQIEHKPRTHAHITISPTPNYAVKHNDKDYVVFVEVVEDGKSEDTRSTSPNSKLFEKTTSFATEGDLVGMLTEAAFRRTSIEITINAGNAITALKIPAMPDRTQHGATP